MFNSSFPSMDSKNSNVHFRFDVVINGADTWKCATNETRASYAMDDHVERSVLRSRVSSLPKQKQCGLRAFFSSK